MKPMTAGDTHRHEERIGTATRTNRVVPPGPEQDLLLRAATEEIQDRGFIVSSVDRW